MKKVFVMATVVFALLLTSCNKNDDDNSQDPLIGVWNYKSTSYINDAGETVNVDYDDCEKKSTYEFTADGKFKDVYYVSVENECLKDGEDPGIWKKSANKVYEIKSADVNFSGEIKFSGNTITINFDGDVEPYTAVFEKK